MKSAADRAELGSEQVNTLSGCNPIRNHEVGRAVENNTRGRARTATSCRRRNHDYEGGTDRKRIAISVIKGGDTRIIIRNPERSFGRKNNAPRINQILVGGRGDAG